MWVTEPLEVEFGSVVHLNNCNEDEDVHNVVRVKEEIESTWEKFFGDPRKSLKSHLNTLYKNKKKVFLDFLMKSCIYAFIKLFRRIKLCTSLRLQLLPKWRFHPICACVHVTRKEK